MTRQPCPQKHKSIKSEVLQNPTLSINFSMNHSLFQSRPRINSAFGFRSGYKNLSSMTIAFDFSPNYKKRYKIEKRRYCGEKEASAKLVESGTPIQHTMGSAEEGKNLKNQNEAIAKLRAARSQDPASIFKNRGSTPFGQSLKRKNAFFKHWVQNKNRWSWNLYSFWDTTSIPSNTWWFLCHDRKNLWTWPLCGTHKRRLGQRPTTTEHRRIMHRQRWTEWESLHEAKRELLYLILLELGLMKPQVVLELRSFQSRYPLQTPLISLSEFRPVENPVQQYSQTGQGKNKIELCP